MLKITFWKGVFVADHQPGPDERSLKKAGFAMHEPTLCKPDKCRACRAKIGRRYWSARVEAATRLHKYCNERARSVMKEHLQKLGSSRATDANIKIPAPPGLVYKPYQKAGVAYALQKKDTLFADEPGLGKTIESLGVINCLRPNQILIVSPATLTINWKLEAEKWLCEGYRYFLPKTTSDRVSDVRPGERLCVITNYEKIGGNAPRVQQVDVSEIVVLPSAQDAAPKIYLNELSRIMPTKGFGNPAIVMREKDGTLVLHSGHAQLRAAQSLGWPRIPAYVLPRELVEGVKDFDPKKIRIETPLSRSLLRDWDVAIYDEAHALKTPDSKRARAVLGNGGLYDRAKRNLFLSGTPMENAPIEIWNIAQKVCPGRFGDWWDFTRRYCGLHQESRGRSKVWVYNGSTNHSELQQRLRTSFMVRRLKVDVLKELPPKRRQLIVMPSENVDWSAYPHLAEWKRLHESEYDDALAQMEAARTVAEYQTAAKALETITVGFTETSIVRHETALLKLPSCLAYTDELLASGCDALVIFAHHRDVLEKIHAHYGDQSCVIFGETKMAERMPIVAAFQAGKYKIFIGGLRAAGTGITLTRASNLVFFETDWNPSTMRQAEDRLARIGQKKMVNIIHPVLDGSLDANMVKKAVMKQEVLDRVLDQLPEDMRMKLGFEKQAQL